MKIISDVRDENMLETGAMERLRERLRDREKSRRRWTGGRVPPALRRPEKSGLS